MAHPENFPSGIKALAAYAHGKGLKLGLYTVCISLRVCSVPRPDCRCANQAMGNGTCADDNSRGSALGLGCDFGKIPECARAKQDIDDYVSWDIDHLKVDGCGQFDNIDQNNSYAIVGAHLLEAARKRGSPVVYHPSNLGFRHPRQFRELVSIANQWRWFDDVQSTWESVTGIIAEVGAGQPHCIDEPVPASCTGFDFSAKATNCSKYCSEVQHFLEAPRPGACAYHLARHSRLCMELICRCVAQGTTRTC